MATKKDDSENYELDTISFRGIKDKWIDFLYISKKKGNKNIWSVLEPMIDEYIKKNK